MSKKPAAWQSYFMAGNLVPSLWAGAYMSGLCGVLHLWWPAFALQGNTWVYPVLGKCFQYYPIMSGIITCGNIIGFNVPSGTG